MCVSSPAECAEPGQIVGVVNAVADGDDLMKALDLNTEDLNKEKQQRVWAKTFLLVWNTLFYRRKKNLYQMKVAASGEKNVNSCARWCFQVTPEARTKARSIKPATQLVFHNIFLTKNK